MSKTVKNDTNSKVKMVSYSIKMTIPTGQYANIMPEIIVKANTPEEAEAYIVPHMNKLWKDYYMCSERRVEIKPSNTVAPTTAPAPTAEKQPVDTKTEQSIVPPSPSTSVSFNKASQAIAGCQSQEALDLLTEQIRKSVKLDDQDKGKLMEIIINKIKVFKAK